MVVANRKPSPFTMMLLGTKSTCLIMALSLLVQHILSTSSMSYNSQTLLSSCEKLQNHRGGVSEKAFQTPPGEWDTIAENPRPIQLVAPDESHTGFVVKEEGIRLLESIPAPIAIISAVGNIHTGKSFLMNQLLGETKGFPLGYTVSPGTIGLWVWSKPLKYKSSDPRYAKALSTSILFIDAEGFHGPNVSKSYDQTLYAIASLLSSEVLFVTIKMMDSRDLEYLEELTKGANLFALRAYARSVSSVLQNNELNSPDSVDLSNILMDDVLRGSDRIGTDKLLRKHADSAAIVDSLSPSCLSWVVQDFIQDLEGKSPIDWLNSLIDSTPSSTTVEVIKKGGSKEGVVDSQKPLDAFKIEDESRTPTHSLRDMYETINSVILPAPAEADKMQRLDTLKNDQLLPEYLKEIEDFRNSILDRVSKNPKKRGKLEMQNLLSYEQLDSKIFLSGSDLADLLKFLVKAANQNFFDDIDIFMDQFLQVRADVTKNDLKKLYDSAMVAFMSKSPPPLPNEMQAYSTELYGRTLSMWKQHILGDSAREWAKSTQSVLEQSLLSSGAEYSKRAVESIRLYCEQNKQRIAMRDEAAISEKRSAFPIVKSNLEEWILVQKSRSSDALHTAINVDGREYAEVPVCNEVIQSYYQHFLALCADLKKENNVAIASRYDQAIEKAVEEFYKTLHDKRHILAFRSEQQMFEEHVFQWKLSAIDEFKSLIGDLYSMAAEASEAEKQLHIRLREPEEDAKRLWDHECVQYCDDIINRWERSLRASVFVTISLPAEEESLDANINDLIREAEKEMKALYCAEASIWKTKAQELSVKLQVIHKTLEIENIEAIKRYFEEPLESVTMDLNADAKKYAIWSSFASLATKQARAMINKNMDVNATSPLRLSSTLVSKVIQNWLDKELHQIYFSTISQNFYSLLQTVIGICFVVFSIIVFLFFHWTVIGFISFCVGLFLILGFKLLAIIVRSAFRGLIIYTFNLANDHFGFEFACILTFAVIASTTLFGMWRFKLFRSSNPKTVTYASPNEMLGPHTSASYPVYHVGYNRGSVEMPDNRFQDKSYMFRNSTT